MQGLDAVARSGKAEPPLLRLVSDAAKLQGVAPSEIRSVWVLGGQACSAQSWSALVRELCPDCKVVLVDGSSASQDLPASLQKERFELVALERDSWAQCYASCAQLLLLHELDPRQAVWIEPAGFSQVHPCAARAVRELFDGYGVASGREIVEEGEIQCLEPDKLQVLLTWCELLAQRKAYLSSLLLAYPLHAATGHLGLASMISGLWVELGCFERAAQWLSKGGMDYRTRKQAEQELSACAQSQRAARAQIREKNLDRLDETAPEIAAQLRALDPEHGLEVATTMSVPWLRRRNAEHWTLASAELPVLLDVHEHWIEPVAPLDPALSLGLVSLKSVFDDRIAVGGAGALDVLGNLALCRYSATVPNWTRQITVMMRDPKQALALMEIEHPAVDLLVNGEVELLWGVDAHEDLIRAFRTQPSRALPKLCSGLGAQFGQVLGKIREARQEAFTQAVYRIRRHHGTDHPHAVLDKLQRGEPLRVYIPTSIYTSVLQYVARELAAAFTGLGHDVHLMVEPDARHEVTAHSASAVIAEHRPDFAVMIDALRSSQSAILPETIASATWILDELPRLEEPERIQAMSPTDMAFVWGGHLVDKYGGALGYPHCDTLPFAVSPKVYRPKPGVRPEPSVAYATHIPAIPDVSQRPGFLERVQDALEDHDTATLDLVACKPIVQAVLAAGPWGVVSPQEHKALVYAACQVARRTDRMRIARTMIDAGLPVALYGKGWDKCPEFAPFARGVIEPGEALCEMYQRHRAVLHINQNCNMHPRVLQCISSGGFVLARANRAFDHLPGGAASFLDLETELCTFNGSDELVAKLQRAVEDDAWRQGFIDRGLLRVRRDHSYQARAKTLLAQLQARLEWHCGVQRAA